MATLREMSTARTILLEPEHVVGRAPTCSLRLAQPYVSAQHAILRYDGHDGRGWVLRDLASRNGTWLDGDRVAAGQELLLRAGARVSFGMPSDEWEVTDDTPPAAMLVPLDGGSPMVLEGDVVALPSAEDPEATVYRGLGDSWLLESGDGPPVPLANYRVFTCGGRTWRFSWPDNVRATTRADGACAPLYLSEVALEFTVSLDEEHVSIRVRGRERLIDLGERAYHYLVLTLARTRMAHAAAGLPEADCGWVDVDDLCRPSMTRSQISVEVYRIRKQLAENGVLDAARIIERRPGQLRVGVHRVTVSRT